MEEITFRGAEGGPGRQRREEDEVRWRSFDTQEDRGVLSWRKEGEKEGQE